MPDVMAHHGCVVPNTGAPPRPTPGALPLAEAEPPSLAPGLAVAPAAPAADAPGNTLALRPPEKPAVWPNTPSSYGGGVQQCLML